jgi:hypothetical protein
LTGELVHKSGRGLERSGKVTLGLLTVEVEFGGFRSGNKGRLSVEARARGQQRPYSLKHSFEGHDGLDEQGLSVLHVHVEETHKGNSLYHR